MHDESEPSAPASQSPTPGQNLAINTRFQKGKSGNPSGRKKGALSKTTKLRNLMTAQMHQQASQVLKNVLKKASGGSLEHEKLAVSIFGPFLKAEAAKVMAPGAQRPNVYINVSPAAVPARAEVISVKPLKSK